MRIQNFTLRYFPLSMSMNGDAVNDCRRPYSLLSKSPPSVLLTVHTLHCHTLDCPWSIKVECFMSTRISIEIMVMKMYWPSPTTWTFLSMTDDFCIWSSTSSWFWTCTSSCFGLFVTARILMNNFHTHCHWWRVSRSRLEESVRKELNIPLRWGEDFERWKYWGERVLIFKRTINCSWLVTGTRQLSKLHDATDRQKLRMKSDEKSCGTKCWHWGDTSFDLRIERMKMIIKVKPRDQCIDVWRGRCMFRGTGKWRIIRTHGQVFWYRGMKKFGRTEENKVDTRSGGGGILDIWKIMTWKVFVWGCIGAIVMSHPYRFRKKIGLWVLASLVGKKKDCAHGENRSSEWF